ncbi:hypothetical protein ACFLR7_03755 [Acidobacteriota bacterium]
MKKESIILFVAISFLILRNFPLCLLMPIWAHGDEIGHFDYILKLNRGHLPQPTDYIESQLFLLHKVHYDTRYTTTSGYRIQSHEELGLAQYSYEAHQPPLPYIVLSFFRKAMLFFNPPLLLQVKLLRIISLLAVALGLIVIYLGLKAAKIQEVVFYIPLLIIPILVKDMFFSLNTDCFSFLFGSVVVAGAIRLFKEPCSAKNWLWLSLGTVLAMWTKIPNAFLLALWPVLVFLLWRKFPNKKVLKQALIFFLLVLLFSSPWYVYNLTRFSSPFESLSALPFPDVPTPERSLKALSHFFFGFLITLFHGEFVWNGSHFHFLSRLSEEILFNGIPIIFFLLGFTCIFFPYDKKHLFLFRFLILGGGISLFAFCFAHFTVGGVPFSLARYAYGALYLYIFVFTAGWKRLFSAKDSVLIIPLVGLFLYHVVYTYLLLIRVF